MSYETPVITVIKLPHGLVTVVTLNQFTNLAMVELGDNAAAAPLSTQWPVSEGH